MWVNYHSHNRYCDGKGEIHDYIAAATRHKLFNVGISSHAPVPFDCKWCMKKENLEAYLQDIDLAKENNKPIRIYKGLEIDFIPGVISPNHFQSRLDYTIGAIHFVEKFADGRRWEIDGTHSHFEEGLNLIFKNSIKDAVIRYFELTKEMLYSSSPDIIAHLDKIKIQNINEKYFKETDTWYKQEVIKLLNVIAHSNTIIEVNTRGIYQKKSATTYPSPWILQLILERNIPITLSSDAHHPDDIINYFPEAALSLSKIGFKTIAVLVDQTWKQLPFTDKGILFD